LDDLLGLCAESRAGHDKGNFYIIIGEDKEALWVADGKSKTVAKPKRKNKKHLQVMKAKVNEELRAKLRNNEAVTNEEIKQVLKGMKE
jgi:ribosomal protein L14E/L6E/L27E